MKYLSRLTALLLALVLLFSSSVGSIAEANLSDLTRSSYDQMVAAAKEAAEAEAAAQAMAALETETELQPTTLTMEDSGFAFEISGDMPADAEMYVTTLDQDTVDYITENIIGEKNGVPEGISVQAFDMGLVSDNEKWQPDTPVRVTITGLDITEDGLVTVVHIPDQQPAVATYGLRSSETEESAPLYEVLSSSVSNGDVTFSTNGFSIMYVIYDKDGKTELDAGENVSTIQVEVGQIVEIESNLSWNILIGLLLGIGRNDFAWADVSENESFEVLSISGKTMMVKATGSGSLTVQYGANSGWWGFFYGDAFNIVCLAQSTVTLESNYPESAGMQDKTKEINTNEGGSFAFLSLNDCDFEVPENYEFAGWSSSETDATYTYPVGAEGSVDNATVYYAQWFDKSKNDQVSAYFRIRLDGTIPPEPAEYPFSDYTAVHGLEGTIKQAIAISNNLTLVKANIDFAPVLEDVVYGNIGYPAPTLDANETLDDWLKQHDILWYVVKNIPASIEHTTADWHVDGIVVDNNKNLVIYDANGGSNAPSSSAYAPGDIVKVELKNIPTRLGYTFLGWSTDSTAKEPMYYAGTDTVPAVETFIMPDTNEAEYVTLYAVWDAVDVTPYTVEHYIWLEKSGNKEWVLRESEPKYGTTDTMAYAEYKNYPGYAPYYREGVTVDSGTISAEIPLVMKLYYMELEGPLTVTKEVTSSTIATELIPKGQVFSFKLELWTSYTDETTNERLSGRSLTYTKTDAAGGKSTGSFKYSFPYTFTLKAGETMKFDDIQATTVYRVTEDETGLASKGFALVKAVDNTGYIQAEGSGLERVAKFTNSYTTATLRITKNVVGVAAPAGDEFTFEVTLPDGKYSVNNVADALTVSSGKGTLTLKGGSTAVISGIPSGSTYAVVEQPKDDYTSAVTNGAASGTMTDVGAAVTFTNTYRYSNLTISKTLTDETGLNVEHPAFEFAVKLTDADGNGLMGSFNYTNGSTTGTVANGDTVRLKAGETATIEKLPVGTSYVVAETIPAGYRQTEKTGDAGTIVAESVAAAEFTNEYRAGKLTITKTGMENGESAIVKVTVTTDTETKTWNVVLNAVKPTVTLSNLQANASYEVEEVDSWTMLYSVEGYTNRKGMIPGGGEATATIENTRADKWLNDESYEKNVFNKK